MLPDFPHNIRKAKLRRPQGRDLATSGNNKQKFQFSQSYSYITYEESLVSSNLNSKQFRFHGAHPTVHVHLKTYTYVIVDYLKKPSWKKYFFCKFLQSPQSEKCCRILNVNYSHAISCIMYVCLQFKCILCIDFFWQTLG